MENIEQRILMDIAVITLLPFQCKKNILKTKSIAFPHLATNDHCNKPCKEKNLNINIVCSG